MNSKMVTNGEGGDAWVSLDQVDPEVDVPFSVLPERLKCFDWVVLEPVLNPE